MQVQHNAGADDDKIFVHSVIDVPDEQRSAFLDACRDVHHAVGENSDGVLEFTVLEPTVDTPPTSTMASPTSAAASPVSTAACPVSAPVSTPATTTSFLVVMMYRDYASWESSRDRKYMRDWRYFLLGMTPMKAAQFDPVVTSVEMDEPSDTRMM